MVSVTVAIVAPCWGRSRLLGVGRRGEMAVFFLSPSAEDAVADRFAEVWLEFSDVPVIVQEELLRVN